MRKTPFDGLRANGVWFDFKGLFPFALSPSKGEVAFVDSLGMERGLRIDARWGPADVLFTTRTKSYRRP